MALVFTHLVAHQEEVFSQQEVFQHVLHHHHVLQRRHVRKAQNRVRLHTMCLLLLINKFLIWKQVRAEVGLPLSSHPVFSSSNT